MIFVLKFEAVFIWKNRPNLIRVVKVVLACSDWPRKAVMCRVWKICVM